MAFGIKDGIGSGTRHNINRVLRAGREPGNRQQTWNQVTEAGHGARDQLGAGISWDQGSDGTTEQMQGMKLENFHILAFYYLLNHGWTGLPEYSMVAMLDDLQVAYFDSTLQRAVPRQQWMAYSFPRDHWNAMAITVAGFHGIVRGNIEIIYLQHHSVSTPAVFFVQGICGCEVNSDNSTDGFIRLGYDGEDACVFDKETMSWIALNPEFQILADRWNVNTFMNKYFKALLEKDCVKWLLIYLECGQEALQRRATPEVCIGIKSDGPQLLRLSCLVTGFYPQAIDVTWLRDGELVLEIESSGVLPNQDETYQVMKAITLSGDDGAKFSCYIEHATLLQGLSIPQESVAKEDAKTRIMTGAAIIPLILLGIITGIGFWKKRKSSKPLRNQQGSAEISSDREGTVVTQRGQRLPQC
ncbi:major histocompatibility complex class I-related gene protein-like [Pristis pectinata]|uniref:major histocompatibility complex class I-related gene protein-like n=1 Tax=Pristis pectinata TaxID=685728 RepID=UPI00223DCD90|nr:major histocompatibility complex class I-related gene protein-like [Pristis pectinata]